MQISRSPFAIASKSTAARPPEPVSHQSAANPSAGTVPGRVASSSNAKVFGQYPVESSERFFGSFQQQGSIPNVYPVQPRYRVGDSMGDSSIPGSYEKKQSRSETHGELQQQLASLQQQMAVLGSKLKGHESSSLPIYSENPITVFPTLPTANLLTSTLGNSAGMIIGEKLNGQNYFSWSQTIKMVLEGRHRFGYLTREILQPSPGDPQERVWKTEDSLLRSMLISSMDLKLGNSCYIQPLHGISGMRSVGYILEDRMHLAYILYVNRFMSASKGAWM
ncbi:uncharacterized protein LOC120068266 [Benincasa hispida]|uniref:uncharacterized protein LOC120068266 n=1 Tax=Benincasa hispida TaxID=102211 RepID=UPI001901CFD2|nr:uncharacterized protein LOC120068266 [Benincasa hispida]